MSKPGAERYKDIPLPIVGSTKFGRYPKMSSEQTYNMIVSDGWLLGFAGYKMVRKVNPTGQGRGIYTSQTQGLMYAVIDNNFISFDSALVVTHLGNLSTSIGDVYIVENNSNQITISDNENLYIYSPLLPSPGNFVTKTKAALGFRPGYITFQDTRTISPDLDNSLWRLSANGNSLSYPTGSQYEGAIQTKPTKAVATVRMPGKGNLLLVFGNTVAELWYDVGAQLFPYQRSQSTNIDYGCLNASTIAETDTFVAWLAANEKSGPVIMFTNGGEIKHISTDGIDFRLANLSKPQDSYGFAFKQDGHLFYIITFTTDNLTYAYDFNTQMFFTLSDENMNAFIAKRVTFYNGQYYFVSIRDGNLYQLGSQFTNYDYGDGNVFEIPRIRIVPSISLPDQSRFVAGYTGFTIEQGQFDFPDNDTRFYLTTEDNIPITTEDGRAILGGGYNYTANSPKILLSISRDGGVNFGTKWAKDLYPLGQRKSKLIWRQLGAANDMTQQFEFVGFGRFVCHDGVTGIYQ